MRNVILVIMVMLAGASLVQADTDWTSGHHEIKDGDIYGEIWMDNDATADMFGGHVFQLGTFDSSRFNMYGGTMDRLMVRGNSVVNIHSGELGQLVIYTSGYYKYNDDDNTYEYIYDNGLVNLHAYDVVYHPGGDTSGWIDGKYIANDQYFVFDGISPSIYASYINVVPEPLDAEIDITPDTLNLASKGKWISCKIWLPDDYNVADVNSETVFIEDEIPAEWIWFNERQNVVMAKFARSELQQILEPGEVELTVTGCLLDGTYFEGTDTIRVIDKGKVKQLRRKRSPK